MRPIMVLILELILSIGLFSVSHQSTNIRLIPDTDNSNLQIGAVELKINDVWYPVCERFKEVWGKREATVACQQLQFKGGWPFNLKARDTVAVHKRLENFKCNGDETRLQDCTYKNTTQNCANNRLAGVQCYNSFQVQLIGGAAPNAGRVEVKYDDVWSSVCYQMGGGQRGWSFYNVQVVCRELGFPGALIQEPGSKGQATNPSIVHDFRCQSHLKYASLRECVPDAPIPSPDHPSPSCGYQPNSNVTNEAVAVCAVPGYLGCYDKEAHLTLNKVELQLTANMTINICRNHCRNHNYHIAALSGASMCSCGDIVISELSRDGDRDCTIRCPGDNDQICGGIGKFSIYNVSVGVCDDPMNGTTVYYYGDMYRFEGFKCDPDQQLYGATSIQCVLGESPQEVKWSEDFPQCKSKNQTIVPKNGDEQSVLGIVIGVAVGSLVLVIFLVVLIIYVRSRHRPNIRESKILSKESTSEMTNIYSIHHSTVTTHQRNHATVEDVDMVTENSSRMQTDGPYAEVTGERPAAATNSSIIPISTTIDNNVSFAAGSTTMNHEYAYAEIPGNDMSSNSSSAAKRPDVSQENANATQNEYSYAYKNEQPMIETSRTPRTLNESDAGNNSSTERTEEDSAASEETDKTYAYAYAEIPAKSKSKIIEGPLIPNVPSDDAKAGMDSNQIAQVKSEYDYAECHDENGSAAAENKHVQSIATKEAEVNMQAVNKGLDMDGIHQQSETDGSTVEGWAENIAYESSSLYPNINEGHTDKDQTGWVDNTIYVGGED